VLPEGNRIGLLRVLIRESILESSTIAPRCGAEGVTIMGDVLPRPLGFTAEALLDLVSLRTNPKLRRELGKWLGHVAGEQWPNPSQTDPPGARLWPHSSPRTMDTAPSRSPRSGTITGVSTTTTG
jgi:hypothetical protein